MFAVTFYVQFSEGCLAATPAFISWEAYKSWLLVASEQVKSSVALINFCRLLVHIEVSKKHNVLPQGSSGIYNIFSGGGRDIFLFSGLFLSVDVLSEAIPHERAAKPKIDDIGK